MATNRLHHHLLQLIESLRIDFQHGIVVIDHRVDERVGQIIAAKRSHLAGRFAEAVSHAVKTIARPPFLKAEQPIGPDEETHLLGAAARVIFAAMHHPQHDE